MVKDDPHLGCGIYPFIFRGWPKYACHWHDHAYTKGSWAQSNLTREQTDKWFLTQMLYLAKDNSLKKAGAYAMYGATRALGWVFFDTKPVHVEELEKVLPEDVLLEKSSRN